MVTARAAVLAELEAIGVDLEASALAASALALADAIDDVGTSPNATAACARELRETLAKLHELAPPQDAGDSLDELKRARAKRLDRLPAS